jgi:hypothetical protein
MSSATTRTANAESPELIWMDRTFTSALLRGPYLTVHGAVAAYELRNHH